MSANDSTTGVTYGAPAACFGRTATLACGSDSGGPLSEKVSLMTWYSSSMVALLRRLLGGWGTASVSQAGRPPFPVEVLQSPARRLGFGRPQVSSFTTDGWVALAGLPLQRYRAVGAFFFLCGVHAASMRRAQPANKAHRPQGGGRFEPQETTS